MPTRAQVLQSIGQDCDYESAASRLAFEDKVLLFLPEVVPEQDRRELGKKILRAECEAEEAQAEEDK